MINSFVTFMTLLPAILPTWQEKPMPKNYLTYDLEGYKSEIALTNKQKEALTVEDPVFRLNVLWKLSLLENEDAAKVMLDFIATENDPLMKTAALRYLYNCTLPKDAKSTVEKLINGQTSEGIAAARLYCRFENADLAKVSKLLSNSSLKDKISLVKALAETKRITAKEWRQICKESTEYSFRVVPLHEIARNPDDASIDFLKKILKVGSQSEKAVIALNLKVNDKTMQLLAMCLSEKHATVRSAAAAAALQIKGNKFHTKLINLSRDSDSEVRKSAVRSLQAYPNKSSVEALYKALGDKELLVQKVAVESLKVISKKFDIAPFISKGIQNGNVGLRRWTAHLLGFLIKKENANAIASQLKKEKDFDARTEQVYALGQFKYKLSAQEIKKLSTDHERVRAALMHYLGKINDKKYFQLMHDTAMKDTAGFVRWASLEAMGRNGDPWFNKTLLAIMKDLDKENMRDYQDRAVACWAAGKIRGLSKPMIELMIKYMKVPTIPVVMGPNTYDNSHVLLSIQFAFCDQYHSQKPGEMKDYFLKFAKFFHFRFTKDRRSVDFPRSFHNDNYTEQGLSYLMNEKAPRVHLPKRKLNWDYKEAK
ncbi:MAG: HEAT repeat domain-containing protein [Lentisphaerales bacterium]|nr:HEAT repeat domain-containing protein [Lentisphaerales bacterium]